VFGGVQANGGRGLQPVDPRLQFGPQASASRV
jgi:hypothetical protein